MEQQEQEQEQQEQEQESSSSSSGRWTCDACGCHTNSTTENPLSCSICGSSRQIPDVLGRREDSLVSSQFLRRTLFGRRAGFELGRSLGDDDDDEHTAASLALEVAGIAAARIPGARSRSARDFIRRSSEGSLSAEVNRNTPAPEQLQEAAEKNANTYVPVWSPHEQHGVQHDTHIEVGKEEHQNVAMAMFGAEEGRTVRASNALPREGESNVVGFRVAFKRPHSEKGKNLGGGYLVGITTSSFSKFNGRNALQQSQHFWGIDDAGNRYEGPGSSGSLRPRRPVSAPRNRDGMIFGSSEIITVIVDLDGRTITFWREGEVLGTLVRTVPRSGALFPVVVPFNAGCIVAITKIGVDPNESIESFEKQLIEGQAIKEAQKLDELRSQRATLIQDGVLTPNLVKSLKTIFKMYAETDGENATLDPIQAARLWYRCGIKLSCLNEMVEKDESKNCSFDNFMEVIRVVLQEDEEIFSKLANDSRNLVLDAAMIEKIKQFEVGDIVELVEGFEKYGDAARGPMVCGDRGQVVEVQRGSGGERHSIRVLMNGRRWWYQPQTLVSERSRLIDSHGVWFIRRILRSHGINEQTLQPMWGQDVTPDSWRVGDLVVPKKGRESDEESDGLAILHLPCVGRVVSFSTAPGMQTTGNERNSGFLNVEFVNHEFGSLTDVDEDELEERPLCRVHKVHTSKLLHAGISLIKGEVRTTAEMIEEGSDEVMAPSEVDSPLSDHSHGTERTLRESLSLVSKLNVGAIESISRECERSAATMVKLFGMGLPVQILSALDAAKSKAERGDGQESKVLPAISAMGDLATSIARSVVPEKGSEGKPKGGLVNETRPDKQDLGDMFTSLSDLHRRASSGASVDAAFASVAELERRREGLRSAPESGAMDSSRDAKAERPQPTNFMSRLESIRRGGFEKIVPGTEPKRGSVLNSGMKSAIWNGLLTNNFAWLHRVVETAKKKKGASSSLATTFNTLDEDSISLLDLAVSLGCSSAIVSYLAQGGATITHDIIRRAAYNGQIEALRQLLVEYSVVENVVDRSRCSRDVIEVFDEAVANQARQEATLRDDGLSFLGSFVHKLLQLGPVCGNTLEPGRIIHRSIAELFVGRILLKAMDQNRFKVLASIGRSNTSPAGADQESGRVPIFNHDTNEICGTVPPSGLAGSEGLLFVLPDECLDEFLLKREENECSCLEDYLLFLEVLLWSRDVDHVALGLSMTAVLLRRKLAKDLMPSLRRFGICQLVDHHRNWSQYVLDRQEVNGESIDSAAPSDKESHVGTMVAGGLILCPKKHPAELHITRHSSFRCDLCGKGVDRGFPMHGCRECDWDACEDCINKGHGNTAKWRHTKSIAEECLGLLAQGSGSLQERGSEVQSSALSTMLKGLRAHDDDAIRQLSSLLRSRGALTMFEFSHLVLPALHEAAVGPLYRADADRCGSINKSIPRGQGKRQKVVQSRQSYISRTSIRIPREFLQKLVRTMILQPLEEKTDTSGNQPENKTGQGKHRMRPELIRRLHQLISFFEQLPIVSDGQGIGGSGEIHTLTSPIEVTLVPSRLQSKINGRQQGEFKIMVEPLLRLSELQNQVLRSSAHTSRDYVKYCKSLCDDKAIICFCLPSEGSAESNTGWQLAHVVSYSEATGTHKVKLASTSVMREENESTLVVDLSKSEIDDIVAFDGKEIQILLAPMRYFVVHRVIDPTQKEYRSIVQSVLISKLLLSPSKIKALPDGCVPPGSRAQFNDESGQKPCTIIGCERRNEKKGDEGGGEEEDAGGEEGGKDEDDDDDDDNDNGLLYDVVLDSGEVLPSVESGAIDRGASASGKSSGSRVPIESQADEEESEGPSGSGGSIMAIRRLGRFEDREERTLADTNPCVLKRTWSALALRKELNPVDISSGEKDDQQKRSKSLDLLVDIGEQKKAIRLKNLLVENPPGLQVAFSSVNPMLPRSSKEDATVFSVLHPPSGNGMKDNNTRERKVYFAVSMQMDGDSVVEADPTAHKVEGEISVGTGVKHPRSEGSAGPIEENIEESMDIDDYFESIGIGEEQAVERCICLIDLFGVVCEDLFAGGENESASLPKESIFSTLQSQHLTDKLLEQIGNPLVAAGGSLPDWCMEMPSFSPRLFGYDSRRSLLERSAFGVSRSVMKQQESKVKVKPLRDRMAALRGRAVELVGEAFSGGAEDPTALQLQADELYGMEEALDARVQAAFRAQKWRERALECVKAAVHRESLLADAASVMDSYASNPSIRQRRLEIRFEGESGFDAAAGDEAGVTRGFYADIAESLLNVEFVSEAQCSPTCDSKIPAKVDGPRREKEASFEVHQTRLPLWIPDTANGAIIPTPRARLDSNPGVYPRPLSPHDPQIQAVLAQFRFMGRVFACAMRDGFMFPLPLSSAFLKLVQFGSLDEERVKDLKQPAASRRHPAETRKDPVSPCRPAESSFDEMSCYENTPSTGHRKPKYLGSDQSHSLQLKQSTRLTIKDLPRPGFFGGEVYAVLAHTCKKLDEIDSMCLTSSELEERYAELASNQDFAREALGKDYDCSFDTFFDGKVFVDPLDPAQDDQSVPLCPQGHLREVTIHNVREWAELGKEFFLHGGVIQQAIAFREGVNDFFSSDFLRIFTAEELQRDVCGGGDNVDRWTEEDVKNLFSMSGAKGANEALVAVAAIGGEGGAALSRRFGSSSPTIGFLIKTLLKSTPMQRRQFLNFVTSVPIVTPGKIEVVPIVSPSGEFLPVNETVMPRANTCARRLYLPKFEGFEKFSQVLWAVIQEESKFKGFYEWRG